MATVDSKQEQLVMPVVIAMAVRDADLGDTPQHAALLSIIKEGTLPNADMVQFGNTVFISHMNESGKACIFRTLNVDTARNMLFNGTAYLKYMYEKGVRYLVTEFDQPSYASMIKLLEKRPFTDDTKIGVAQTPKGKTQVQIYLGGERL